MAADQEKTKRITQAHVHWYDTSTLRVTVSGTHKHTTPKPQEVMCFHTEPKHRKTLRNAQTDQILVPRPPSGQVSAGLLQCHSEHYYSLVGGQLSQIRVLQQTRMTRRGKGNPEDQLSPADHHSHLKNNPKVCSALLPVNNV